MKKVVFSKTAASLFIKPLLRCHSWCYKWAGWYAAIMNSGVHPKHRILKYKEWFLDYLEPEWTVMDVGCGNGLMPAVLSQKVGFVYGIEINPELLASAKVQNSRPNIEYICGDATTLSYKDLRPVNCITLSNVLEHIENRIDFLIKLIHQVNWSDNMNKRFLVRVPLIEREWIVLYKKELGLEYRLDSTHYVEYTYEQFEEELRQAGIDIIESETRFGELHAVCVAVTDTVQRAA